MTETIQRIVLASRPVGEPSLDNFRSEKLPIPHLGSDAMVLRTLWLSLDPYMRGRMSDAPSYAKPVGIGDVMEGGTVSEVVASNLPRFAKGDIVVGRTGWQTHALSDGSGLQKVDPTRAPIQTALGVLGMPGMTAYMGLLEIGKPAAGETVVVAAASGAVGSVVGQIARIKGAYVVGIAGGPEKCRYAIEELGFDACIDHRTSDFAGRLAAACPEGIDIYSDNVGGDILHAVLPCLYINARVPISGQISQYNRGESQGLRNTSVLLDKCVMLQGFRIGSRLARRDQALDQLLDWYRAGRRKFHETVAHGLEGARGAHQHAVGRQYRQAGGAPGRSHRMSQLRRGRFGRRATCKW